MTTSDTNILFRSIIAEKLADSLAAPLPQATPRHIHGQASLPGKVTAVIGMRRAGKTTFLHQVRGERLAAGTPRERLPYINFEDERLAGLGADQLHLLVDEYYRRFPTFRGKEIVTWCFDEIQVVPGWESFVRRLLDSEKVELFLSGSSALLLSREVATNLRGRGWEVLIHPFSFEEFLRHLGHAPPADPGFLSASERSRMEHDLLAYLSTGGFPEVQSMDAETRFRVLRDYVDVAILRDVVERHGVSNVTGLRWLVRQLLSSPAARFSAEKFYAALKSQGIAIAKDTIHQLLGHLEDCFLIRTIWMEAASERKRMANPRKAYPVDPGLIPLFDRTGRANLGHALETAVMLELERRGAMTTYIRTGDDLEVDFLARYGDGRVELIQVCADLDDATTRNREVRALVSAAASFPAAGKFLITITPPASSDIPDTIQVVSACSWFLLVKAIVV